MRSGVTWYGVLGVMPGSSSDEIQQRYDAKAAVLRPEYISGAPSNIVRAVSRAQAMLDEALRVLCDREHEGAPGERAHDQGLAPARASKRPTFGPQPPLVRGVRRSGFAKRVPPFRHPKRHHSPPPG